MSGVRFAAQGVRLKRLTDIKNGTGLIKKAVKAIYLWGPFESAFSMIAVIVDLSLGR